MTREEKINMFCMRMDGYTLQEIADQYGITKERVRQILSVGKGGRTLKIIYPGLKQYLIERKMSIKEFSLLTDAKYQTVLNVFHGKTIPRVDIINKILRATGLTYEKAFSLESGDTADEAQRR